MFLLKDKLQCLSLLVPMSSMTISKLQCWSLEKCSRDEVIVEVVADVPTGDVRVDSEDRASGCSSSFCGTSDCCTDLEDRALEVKSVCRNGNDDRLCMEGVGQSSRRKKRGLKGEWRMHREGIEWRCRWLELRIKELQAKVSRYNEILRAFEKHKGQLMQSHDSKMVARALSVHYKRHGRIFRRQHRKKTEESANLKLLMSKHPVFSRYEKKKRCTSDAFSPAEYTYNEEILGMFLSEDSNDDDGFVFESTSREESMEQLLGHIEALQAHVLKLKSYLSRRAALPQIVLRLHSEDVPSPLTRNSAGNAALFEPKHVPRVTSGPHKSNWSGPWPAAFSGGQVTAGSSISQLRTVNMDTDSVIMPDHVVANYVEPAKESFIGTTPWRLLCDVASPTGESSNDEDTHDEFYWRHRTKSERPLHKDADSTLEKTSSTSCFNGRGVATEKVLSLNIEEQVIIETNSTKFAAALAFTPKRKRWGRKSRDITLCAKAIEGLLSDSYEQALQGCMQVKMQDDKSKCV